MVKYTQTIRRLLPTNCLSVFDDFVGLAVNWLIPRTKLENVINDIYYGTCNTCLALYFFKKSSLRFKGRNLVIKTEINVRSLTVKALFVYLQLNYFLYWFWFIKQYIDIRLFLLVCPLLTYYLRFDTAVTTCRSLRRFSMFYWI